LVAAHQRIWAHGANSKKLDSMEAERAAVRYVVDGQGDPMAWWLSPDWR
jgi:hypothetical protein